MEFVVLLQEDMCSLLVMLQCRHFTVSGSYVKRTELSDYFQSL